MLVVLSDTHARVSPRLSESVCQALESAAVVAHAGDFTTEASLETFEQRSERLIAVSGNRDTAPVRTRVPAQQTFSYGDRRFVLVHGHRHDPTSLSLLARQERADVVLVGHTHRPAIERLESHVVLNPGSHADPRGNRTGFAVFEPDGEQLVGRLMTTEGDVFETVRV